MKMWNKKDEEFEMMLKNKIAFQKTLSIAVTMTLFLAFLASICIIALIIVFLTNVIDYYKTNLQNKEVVAIEDNLIVPTTSIIIEDKSLVQSNIEIQPKFENVSKGKLDRFLKGPIIMLVTAYSLDERCCNKTPDHPEYGITYSGNYVQEWHTVAAGKEIPIGTKIYIPYFKDKPNKGIFVVEDRGSGVGENCIDVYIDAPYEELLKFGRKELEVYILEE